MKTKNQTHTVNIILRRSDFSQEALDLGIWDELAEDLGFLPEGVKVIGTRRAA